jgi:hypothetical protein
MGERTDENIGTKGIRKERRYERNNFRLNLDDGLYQNFCGYLLQSG